MVQCEICAAIDSSPALKVGAVLLWAVIGVLVLAETGDSLIGTLFGSGPDTSAVEQQIHEEVNRQRARHGLDTLTYNTEAADIARSHSRDMMERDFFAHECPDGDLVADRYDKAGFECRIFDGDGYLTGGENIAQTWWDKPITGEDGEEKHHKQTKELAVDIVNQWMESPEHRDNLLTPAWESEGIGIVIGADGEVFATQNFC